MKKRIKPAALFISIICIAIIFSISYKRSFISKELVESTYLPVGAVNFIHTYNLPAPIFNPYEWGAYISWKLYPRYKVFVDSRALDPVIQKKYHEAKLGKISSVFPEYGINTVIFYPVNPVLNEVPGLVFAIIGNSAWKMVYLDNISAVFVRQRTMPSIPALGKELLWDSLITRYKSWADTEPGNITPHLQLGIIYNARGEKEKALEYLNQALSIDGDNQRIRAWIMFIQKDKLK